MNIPNVPLRELLELHDSGVWGPEDQTAGISVLRSTNFSQDGSIRFDNLTYRCVEPSKRERKRLLEHDIILEKSGGGPKQPVGRVCIFRGHEIAHTFGNFTARLRVKKSLVNPEYLFWYLRYLHLSGATLRYQEHTSGIRNLDTKRYLEYPISLPPLDEQRRIVATLNRAARIERLRNQARERLREFIPALFVKMFGDPIGNPMGWPVEKVLSLGRVTTGRTPPSTSDGLFGGAIPFITPGDLESDLMVKRSLTSEGAAASRTVDAGATFVCCIGATIGKVGMSTVHSAFNQQINAIEWGGKIHAQYGFEVMRMSKPVITSWGSSTTLPILKKSSFEQIEIPVPPLVLQHRFAEVVEIVESTKGLSLSSFPSMMKLNESLMSQLIEVGTALRDEEARSLDASTEQR